MTNEDQFGYDLFKLSDRVGKQLSRKYVGVDAEDLRQTLCEWGLRNKKTLNPISNNEREKVLRWQGNQVCMAEFDQYLKHSGNWIYTEETVRSVLEVAMTDESVWDLVPAKEMDLGSTVSAGGLAVFLWDLKEGYRKLNERERDLLELRFLDGVKPKDLSKGDRDAISRAVRDLTSHLNRGLYKRSEAHTGPGSSRAHTASAAKARVEQTYDPEERYEDSTGYRFCGGADA